MYFFNKSVIATVLALQALLVSHIAHADGTELKFYYEIPRMTNSQAAWWHIHRADPKADVVSSRVFTESGCEIVCYRVRVLEAKMSDGKTCRVILNKNLKYAVLISADCN